MSVPNWWLRFKCSGLLHAPTPPVFVYWRGLYQTARNDGEHIITITESENLLICLALSFASCRYGRAENFFGYVPFDVPEGGILHQFPCRWWRRLVPSGSPDYLPCVILIWSGARYPSRRASRSAWALYWWWAAVTYLYFWDPGCFRQCSHASTKKSKDGRGDCVRGFRLQGGLVAINFVWVRR